MSIRIICISKDGGNHENPHTAIRDMHWIEESTGKQDISTREEVYDFVKATGNRSAYVKDSRGDIAFLEALVTIRGTKYVRTIPDATKADNLLKLPECIHRR